MNPITYKFIMDSNGTLMGVELWQNGEHITISMSSVTPYKDGTKWGEVRRFMDSVKLPQYVDDDGTMDVIKNYAISSRGSDASR